jgi:hypothetical protein
MRIPIALLIALALVAGRAEAQTSPAPSAPPLVPAGAVPARVDLTLTGTVQAAYALARIRAAIAALAQRQPGTELDVHGITLAAPLAPGTQLDALAGITIAGKGAFADVSGSTQVHVSVADLPPFEPQYLYYSDDPEYVAQDGAIFRATLEPQAPVRLFAYHVAAEAPRRLALVLASDGPARVQLIGASVGPSPAYAYVGQQTTARFLTAHALHEGIIIDVTPDAPSTIDLGTLQPGDLVETIDDLRIVSGGAISLAVVSSATTGPLAALVAGPDAPGDGHGRRGMYGLADIASISLALSSAPAADATPDPVTVGMTPLENQIPGGRVLAGDYGIVRRMTLQLANPSDQPVTFYLYERTLGGSATATLLFDGEDTATLVPCVNDAQQPRLVRSFIVAPQTTQNLAASYMTDGASSYPLEFGLTLTAPLPIPPGACNGSPNG